MLMTILIINLTVFSQFVTDMSQKNKNDTTHYKSFPIPIEMIGTQDTFGESGTPTQLLTKYGLDTEFIVAETTFSLQYPINIKQLTHGGLIITFVYTGVMNNCTCHAGLV